MAIVVKDEKPDYEQCPPGTVQAVCAYVHDIGYQLVAFDDKDKKVQHKAIFSFEINKKMKDGRPFMLSKYYTLSFAEKANLTKDLASWRGRWLTEDERENGFDVEQMVGENCLLSVASNEKGKSTIVSISALPEGMPKIQILNPVPSEKFMAWIERERAKAVQSKVTRIDSEKLPLPAKPNDGCPV
jgi:hypothetical protein